MSIDINIYIGAVAVCRGLQGHDEFYRAHNQERLMSIFPMCGDDIVEGADVFYPNTDTEYGLYLDGKDTETSAQPMLADIKVLKAGFRSQFASELATLRRLCRTVDVCVGIYQWAS